MNKKIISIFILIALFIPFVVNAEDCKTNSVKIKSITLKDKSKNSEELTKTSIKNNKIYLNLKMYDVGDFIEYKIVLDNATDEVYYFDKDSINIDLNYLDYTIIYGNDLNRIEPNSKNIVYLRIEYKKEVEESDFLSGYYFDNISTSLIISNINPFFVNPLTMNNKLLLFIFLFIVSLTLINLNKNNKLKLNTIILLLTIFLPLQAYAICKNTFEINTNVKIGKVTPNPCTYDGELVQGAEYTNGQYTYRYMQEGDGADWEDIDNDGWGVILTNKDSTDNVTTKLCTSINEKSIVSMDSMFFNSKTSNIDLSSLDTSNVINMSSMFNGCANINILNLNNFDTSKVTNMMAMFYGTTSLEKVNLDGFDLTSSTNGSSILGGMFSGASNLKRVSMKNWKIPEIFTSAIGCRVSSLCSESLEYVDVTNWDLSKTKNINGLFGELYAREIKGLETWETPNIEDIGNMFGNIKNIKKLDLSSFDTTKVTNMSVMFSGATSLEEVNLDGFDLTSSTNGSGILGGMFSSAGNLKQVSMKNWKIPELFTNAIGCRVSSLCSESLEYVDVTNWDLSKTKNINGLFGELYAREIKGLETWETPNIEDIGNMFGNIKNIKKLDLSSFDTTKVTNMMAMFSGATSLEEVNLDGFDLTSSTNGSGILGGMFSGASNLKRVSMKNWKIPEIFTSAIGCRVSSLCSESLEYVDVTNWDLSKTKNINGLFGELYAREIKGLETWKTPNIEDIGNMFGNVKNVKELDLSSFDTSKINNIKDIFYHMLSLETLKLNNWDFTNSNFVNFISLLNCNTEKLKYLYLNNTTFSGSMNYAFGGLSNLEELSLKNIDTSNVTSMSLMFSGTKNVKKLDLSCFDTSNVTSMSSMFSGVEKIKTLDLSSFNTSKVTDMTAMFSDCSSLKTIIASDKFEVQQVVYSNSMFNNLPLLVGGNGTTYDPNHTNKDYAKIDTVISKGYFTKK